MLRRPMGKLWRSEVSLLSFCLACATVGGPPQWVDDPYAGHQRQKWLAGVGSGADRETAVAYARTEISQIFQAEIQQVLEDRQTLSTSQRGGKTRSAVVQEVEVWTRLRTVGSLEGVEIAETWRSRDGTHYALAVLDKAAARRALAFEIAQKEEAIRGSLEAASRAGSTLERARATLRAIGPSQKRDALLGRYRVVGGRASPDTENLSSAAVERQVEATLSQVEIRVDAREVDLASGELRAELPTLRSDLAEKLTEMGLKVSSAGASSGGDRALRLVARLGLEPMERDVKGWVFYRWEGSLELEGGFEEASSLSVSSARGEESHPDAGVARARALRGGPAAMTRARTTRNSGYLYGNPES
jgi:hypothetical protein